MLRFYNRKCEFIMVRDTMDCAIINPPTRYLTGQMPLRVNTKLQLARKPITQLIYQDQI
jgi:hypothetical protein